MYADTEQKLGGGGVEEVRVDMGGKGQGEGGLRGSQREE